MDGKVVKDLIVMRIERVEKLVSCLFMYLTSPYLQY